MTPRHLQPLAPHQLSHGLTQPPRWTVSVDPPPKRHCNHSPNGIQQAAPAPSTASPPPAPNSPFTTPAIWTATFSCCAGPQGWSASILHARVADSLTASNFCHSHAKATTEPSSSPPPLPSLHLWIKPTAASNGVGPQQRLN